MSETIESHFQLKLTDVDTNEELVFYINQWLAMDEGDGEIVREFSVDRLGEMSLPCEYLHLVCLYLYSRISQ